MSRKDTLKKIVVEFVSVVFAVLLALGLNHWREDIAEKKLARKALRNIIVEIKSNIKSLSDVRLENEEKIVELRKTASQIKSGEENDYSIGYNHPIMSNSAWTIANSTGAIKDMDLDMVLELSELYIFQDMFQDNGFSYFKVISSPGYRTSDLAAVESLIAQYEASQQFGTGLKNGLEDFLETYKGEIEEVMN